MHNHIRIFILCSLAWIIFIAIDRDVIQKAEYAYQYYFNKEELVARVKEQKIACDGLALLDEYKKVGREYIIDFDQDVLAGQKQMASILGIPLEDFRYHAKSIGDIAQEHSAQGDNNLRLGLDRVTSFLNSMSPRNPDAKEEATYLTKVFSTDIDTVMRNQDYLARVDQTRKANQQAAPRLVMRETQFFGACPSFLDGAPGMADHAFTNADWAALANDDAPDFNWLGLMLLPVALVAFAWILLRLLLVRATSRANTQAKRIALLVSPLFAVISIGLWLRASNEGESPLSSIILGMATILCLLFALTPLGDWVKKGSN